MKSILLLFFCGFSAFAQTKLIAYKSHSGASGHFREALAANFGSVANSNLGEINDYETRIDSVIYISEGKVLLVNHLERNSSIKKRSEFFRDTLKIANLGEKHRLDSAKAAVKRYRSESRMDSTKFVGFDKKPHRKKSFVPLSIADDNWPKSFFIATLLFISLIAAIFVWRMQKLATVRA